MIEENLLNYGVAGLFIAYLIFDRQVLLKSIQHTISENTKVLKELCVKFK